MSIIHYIDNEVPGFGEWDAIVQSGASTIARTSGAAFPERGSYGIHLTANPSDAVYLQKDFSRSIAPGEWISCGFWLKVVSLPYAEQGIFYWRSSTSMWPYYRSWMRISSSGKVVILSYDDNEDVSSAEAGFSLNLDRWYYIVNRTRRATSPTATDGEIRLYIDGALAASITNHDLYYDFAEVKGIRVGALWKIRDGIVDYDEFKIAPEYPEPFIPTPRDEYPSSRRTVVLFRQGDSDSRQFADYCVEKLGIPRANLCPLPNASSNETLADYAAFQAEVENDLSDWLDRNPTVKSNCMCFLIGFGVPGYFYHNGLKHSATSRLMNFGAAFSSKSSNPLYNPDTVERLTKSALGGKYLSVRIDADTLQNAKAIVDRSLSISALSELPSSDVLFCDDNDYCTSLACQHLRINTSGDHEIAQNDAFYFGFYPYFWDIAGTRAAIVDGSVNSANTMRAISKIFNAIVNHSYAGGVGCADDAETFDAESFFEMLRIGGTLAEAFAVAIAHLDYIAVAIGNPLMTVAFRKNGYNIYRGVGGVEHINWDNPVAYLRAEQQVITFKEDLIPHQQYVYAVRAVSPSGVIECNTNVITYVEIDEQGNLSPLPLAKPINLDVATTESGIFVAFSYYTPIGFANPDKFEIVADFGDGQFDLDNPIGIVEPRYVGQYDFDTVVAKEPLLRRIAVRACKGERTGPLSNAVIVPPSLSVKQVKLL